MSKKIISEEKFDELVESKVEDFINNWEMSEDDYEELLDELYGDVQIGSYSYSSGRALKEIDPIAFRCGISEEECPEHEIDEKRDEVIEELEEIYKVENRQKIKRKRNWSFMIFGK